VDRRVARLRGLVPVSVGLEHRVVLVTHTLLTTHPTDWSQTARLGRGMSPFGPQPHTFGTTSREPHRALTALRSLLMVSLASPKRSEVFSSNSSSFSIPAKPGRIDRFMKMIWRASSALRIGIP